jgi:tetrahydromethanopterin S-methyltransferase subunit E
MQLRSLVSLGLGGRVPAFNQFITLLFIVAVQVAVNIQWFLGPHEQMTTAKLDFISGSTTKQPLFQDCFYSHNSFLYLHSYLGILIVVVFLYGLSVLKIRRNYNEAKWVSHSLTLYKFVDFRTDA